MRTPEKHIWISNLFSLSTETLLNRLLQFFISLGFLSHLASRIYHYKQPRQACCMSWNPTFYSAPADQICCKPNMSEGCWISSACPVRSPWAWGVCLRFLATRWNYHQAMQQVCRHRSKILIFGFTKHALTIYMCSSSIFNGNINTTSTMLECFSTLCCYITIPWVTAIWLSSAKKYLLL